MKPSLLLEMFHVKCWFAMIVQSYLINFLINATFFFVNISIDLPIQKVQLKYVSLYFIITLSFMILTRLDHETSIQ